MTASRTGDMAAVAGSIAAGAGVNACGSDGAGHWLSPLAAAVWTAQQHVVTHLLAHGGDANGPCVLETAVIHAPSTLRVLLDCGGDPNIAVGDWCLLLFAIGCSNSAEVVVEELLEHPAVDLGVRSARGETVEQYARRVDEPGVADRVAREVRVHETEVCVRLGP